MSPRSTDVRALEVLAFCRQAGALQGQWPLRAMDRLADGLLAVAPEAMVDWTAQGSLVPAAGAEDEVWLRVQAQATVARQCQRCLQPMDAALDVDRRFRFVRTEAQAAALDETSDDDVLVLLPRLDLMALLEDELILALPIVPMHALCPVPLLPADGDAVLDEQPPHPFAALAALRGRAKD